MCWQSARQWMKSRIIDGLVARKRAAAAVAEPGLQWFLDYRQGQGILTLAASLAVPDAVLAKIRVKLVDHYFAGLLMARIGGLLPHFAHGVKVFLLETFSQIFVWTIFVAWSVGLVFLGWRATQPDFVVTVLTGALWVLCINIFAVPTAFGLCLWDISSILNSKTNDTRWFPTGLARGSFESLYEHEFNQLLLNQLVEDGVISRDGPVSIISLSRIDNPA